MSAIAKYKSEVDGKTIDWEKCSDKERRTAANAIFIPRGFTDRFVDAMQELREGSREGAEAMCLVVVGERGVGKTTLLERYADMNPAQRIVDENVVTITRPVVYLAFPPSPTLKGSATAFLTALAGKSSARGSRSDLTQRIKELLTDLRTELVIADEFQHVRAEGARGKSEVANWLKNIIKDTGVPFVLSGMPETVDIIQADDQLHSLTEEPTIITPYDWETTASQNAWRALLAKIDLELPFNQRSELAAEDTARDLFKCTTGNLRALRALLRIATVRALRNKGKLLTLDDLAGGYDRLPKPVGVKGNPFDKNGLFSHD